MTGFDAPPCEGESKGQVIVRGTGSFYSPAAFAFEAAHGGEFLDECFGFGKGLLDLKLAEVEGELEAADEVLLGDAPEAVDVCVAVSGVDDDGSETPFCGGLAQGVGHGDPAARGIDDEAGWCDGGETVRDAGGSFDDFGIGSADGDSLEVPNDVDGLCDRARK